MIELTNYQLNCLQQLDLWIKTLRETKEQMKSMITGKQPSFLDLKDYPEHAWKSLENNNKLPLRSVRNQKSGLPYVKRTAANGDPIPHACLKIPTGGGKTLLGIAALEKLIQGPGFVLWVVPSSIIYQQTLLAFSDLEHPYRKLLDHISSKRVKLLKKTDKFTKQDIDSHLCIMLLTLPSFNRKKEKKEFLKIFQNSTNYSSFFNFDHNFLLNKYNDLDRFSSEDGVKQSLSNVLKIIRPYVILDEAHKAYGTKDEEINEFVRSVNNFNPRLVLELSATPKSSISNILVNIGGQELKDEEMIKLPIHVKNFTNSSWQYTLDKAQEKLNQLEDSAKKLKRKNGRYIRPIVLVRVKVTGKAQLGKNQLHAEDVRIYLENKAIPKEHIRVYSSEKKELMPGEDLLSESCNVRWIITKDALKEGWDCSFAYILALLDHTEAETAITQMMGRIMRQPHAHLVESYDDLNSCYVYSYNRDTGKVVEWIKQDLENEGLTELNDSIINDSKKLIPLPNMVTKRRLHHTKIFLPQVLHKDIKVKGGWRTINYDRDILGEIKWETIDPGKPVDLTDLDTIKTVSARVDIQNEKAAVEHFPPEQHIITEAFRIESFVKQLASIVPNPWQAARIVEIFLKRLKASDLELISNQHHLLVILEERIRKAIDEQAEMIFHNKIGNQEIEFYIQTNTDLNYEFYDEREVAITGSQTPLHIDGIPVEHSLFDKVFETEFNEFEKSFAFNLEKNKAILWWHKITERQPMEYFVQGWKQGRVYPDFIAFNNNNEYLVIETKGSHLKGNVDTNYKEKLFETLEAAYTNTLKAKKKKGPQIKYKMVFEDTWREEKITE